MRRSPINSLPEDIVAGHMLPFLEKEEIFTFCHVFPALFQNQITWKALVHASSLLFYSQPDLVDRKYKRFLRQRQLTRLNWLTQQCTTYVSKLQSRQSMSFSRDTRLEIATDSSNIAILRTQVDKPDSFIDIHEMNCKFVKTSKVFQGLRHLQANNGKALAVDGQEMVLMSLKTAECLPLSTDSVDDAVFLNDSSIIFAAKGRLCQIDLGKPESYSVLNSPAYETMKLVKPTFCPMYYFPAYETMKLCKTTVRNRVIGYLGLQLTMWDTRQSGIVNQFEIKNTEPMYYNVCAGGENSFFVYEHTSISEYDIRFRGINRMTTFDIKGFQWTPDFLYADVLNIGMERFNNVVPETKLPFIIPGDFNKKRDKFMPDVFNHWQFNKFDITDRYCVNVSVDDSHDTLKLISVGF